MLKKIISIIVLLLFFQNIQANIPTYITLGGACGPSLMLRELNLRKAAYPFDWIVSPFESVYNAIDDDFEYFFQNLTVRSNNQGVIDYYGFHFVHDLPTVCDAGADLLNVDFIGNNDLAGNWEAALPLVREKYQRRIDRFRQACLGKETIFFLSDGLLKEHTLILRDLISKKYPSLDFVLIVFSPNESFRNPWHFEKIRNFCASYNNPSECKKFLDAIAEEFGKSNN